MLIELNCEAVERLSKTELEVVRFINSHESDFPTMSILDIAFDTYTSPATVSRAIKKCGLSGFAELRALCSLKAKDRPIVKANEIITQSLSEVQFITECISPSDLIAATAIIRNAKRIFVVGRGPSKFVCNEFSMKLQLLDHNSMFIDDPNIIKLKTKQMTEDDVLVVFSLNGKTEELITACVNARSRAGKTVVFCCNGSSRLIELADVAFVGYSDPKSSISDYEVRSRLPLYVMSRIITEYIASD